MVQPLKENIMTKITHKLVFQSFDVYGANAVISISSQDDDFESLPVADIADRYLDPSVHSSTEWYICKAETGAVVKCSSTYSIDTLG
jgi:hypothetical protein